MVRRQWLTYLGVALASCVALGCADNGIDIQGAGATFPAPLYKRWFLEYYLHHPEVRINYQAVGSGAGIRQFSAALVDFGASDAAMSETELTKALEENPQREGVLMLPVTAGIIVLCYNVPELQAATQPAGGLKLSRTVYVDIFLGKISNWNDPAIAAINPHVHLPDLPITVVRRADGSGTTYAFTNHLSAVSAEWKKNVGVDKSVLWPVSIGGKGNAGVAALIEQTPGAIGYLEFGYAELLKMPMAVLENKDGHYIEPSLEAGQAALASAKMTPEMDVKIPDPTGHNAYPIVTYTWLLCWKNYGNAVHRTAALKDVLRYCLTDGQKLSVELGYIPLPSEVVATVLRAVDSIKP